MLAATHLWQLGLPATSSWSVLTLQDLNLDLFHAIITQLHILHHTCASSPLEPSKQVKTERVHTHTQIEGAIIVNNCAEFYWIFGMFRSRHAEKFTSRKSATALVADKSGISSAKVGSVFHKPKDKPMEPTEPTIVRGNKPQPKDAKRTHALKTCLENQYQI